MPASEAELIRDALENQWRTIARAIPSRDLDAPSRVRGWRNREVVAHLTMQPTLLVRFLATAGAERPELGVSDNLSGTRDLAELVDSATRAAAGAGRIDFAGAVDVAIAALAGVDLASTVTTLQGPIVLADYLVTRCVEAVVHGGDLVEPVDPDEQAMRITAHALTSLLAARDPGPVAAAAALPPATWIAAATGREPPPAGFGALLPLMA